MGVISLLDVNSFTRNLKEITNMSYLTATGEYLADGLFSESIFGPEGSNDRKTTFAYISLGTKILHPSAYKFIMQLDRRIEKFLSTEILFSLDQNGTLIIDEKNGVTGINEFVKIFPSIKFRGDTPTRNKMISILKKFYNDNVLFIDKIPVIPPEFRPLFKDEVGNISVDNLNDYYITIMRRSSQVQRASGAGPLFDLLVYGLQKSILDYDVYLKSKIAKKPGIIRKSLLGKRIDFSGRAVITPDPNLKVNEIGIPLRLAVSLFEPFLIYYLLNSGRVDKNLLNNEIVNFTGLELSIDTIKKVIKSIKNNDDIPESLYNIIYNSLDVVMTNRVVISKRDPVLHSESVRAYYPKLTRGSTIKLCTLQVGGHNADFDGDQMAVYHPITNEAQQEAKENLTRAKSPDSNRTSTFELSKEMYVGLYIMSREEPLKTSPIMIMKDTELEQAVDPFIPVIYRKNKTTMGRAIINSCLPEDFPFVNKQVNKKIIKNIIDELFKKYDDNIVRESASKLERVGFKFATIMGPSFTLDQLDVPDKIYELKKKLANASPEEAADILDEMKDIIVKNLKGKGLYELIESGAGKGWGQPLQILGAKGQIADAEGNILPPITGSFADGLTNTEYFNASYGARNGILSRVISTADTGYMTRKLIFVLSQVQVDPILRDCGTKRTVIIKLTKDLMDRLTGRFVIDVNERVIEFKKENFKVGQTIRLRTPIYCKSNRLCHICYGKLLMIHKSPYVGVLAGMIIGERGTTISLVSFHTGGSVTVTRKDVLQEIIDNDPLINLER